MWESAHQLTLEIYRTTAQLPREELYSLTSQMLRCSTSIAANIAEGCGKTVNNEFHRFLAIACGSASELDYELLLARDLGYLREQVYVPLREDLSKVRKMLNALLQKVDRDRGRMAKC